MQINKAFFLLENHASTKIENIVIKIARFAHEKVFKLIVLLNLQ